MTTINKVPIEIYPYDVFVICTDTPDEIVSVINRKIKQIRRPRNIEELLYDKNHFKGISGYNAITQSADCMSFIVLKYDESREDCADRITLTQNCAEFSAHESLHVVSDIMKQVGIRWDADNDEPIAYLVGHIAKHCIINFKEFLNKIQLSKIKPNASTI
jgi:hypothetical protein